MATMRLEKSDHPIIFLGILALAVSIFRFIKFSGPANNFMSGFIALIGLYLLFLVFKKATEEEEESSQSSIPSRPGFPHAPRPSLPPSLCPHCGGTLTYIPDYNSWYCYECEEYAPGE